MWAVFHERENSLVKIVSTFEKKYRKRRMEKQGMNQWGSVLIRFRVKSAMRCPVIRIPAESSIYDSANRRTTPRSTTRRGSRTYCSVIFVISGGQFIRNGTPTVPIPRVTYICAFPNLYRPQTYFEKRAAGHTVMFPIFAKTI